MSTGVMLESELARTHERASLSAQGKAGEEGVPRSGTSRPYML